MCAPGLAIGGTRPRLPKEIGLMCSGRVKVCHQGDMLFNCAVQVPHRALRTRSLCLPLLVVRPAVYCYVSRPRKRGVGGAEEARTPDPLLAKEVLSQLSYGPVFDAGRGMLVGEIISSHLQHPLAKRPRVVGHSGLEPETCRLWRPLYSRLRSLVTSSRPCPDFRNNSLRRAVSRFGCSSRYTNSNGPACLV